MNISIVASREDLDQAMKEARAYSLLGQNTHLNATANATLLGRLDTVWDSIESALRKGYSLGADAARGALTSAIAQAEQLIAEAGAFAKECQETLLEKLQRWVRAFINNALKRVPDSLAIAGREFRISKVTCTQKLVLAGSLTTNVTEVFSLTSNGELELGVEYEIPVAST
jgi:hypothetical protein